MRRPGSTWRAARRRLSQLRSGHRRSAARDHGAGSYRPSGGDDRSREAGFSDPSSDDYRSEDGFGRDSYDRINAPRPWPPETGNPPIFNIPPATLTLIGVLVVVYSFLNLFPDALTWPVLVRLTFFYGSLTDLFSAGFDRSVFWNISSLFTHGLVHLLAIHLMVNLGFLLAFGSAVERAIGPRGMLTVFFVSVAAGAIAQLLLDPSTSGALMGASGGVSGCMGCFARLLLRSGTPRRMRRMGFNLIGVLIAMNLAIGVFGDAIFGGALGDAQVRIAWQAHIGGFVAGLLLGSLPWPIPHRRGLWRSH